MDKEFEQTSLQRLYKMVNKFIKIFYTHQEGTIKTNRKQVLVRMQRNWNPCALGALLNDAVAMEDTEVPQ